MASLKSLAVSMFGRIVDKYGSSFKMVKEGLPKANMDFTFRTYMSITFLITLIAFVATVVALFFALNIVEISSMMKIIYMIFTPLIVAVTTFVMMILYPQQRMGKRKKDIESNLPFVLTHMGAVAESGVPPYVIFKLIGRFKEYGEISVEMKKITRNIDNFGLDPLRAVKEVSERTPSDDLKQILMGFVTTTESGGDVKSFLKNAGDQALFDWRIKRERFLQQLSAYAEFYTGILIAAPLFIIALFAVMSMIQPTLGGFQIIFLTKVSIYGIVPLLNVAFLMFLQGTEVEM